MTGHHAALERQVLAADPARSTWLTANAGSGKTRVLTDRVARLLLGGVEPQRILCLTYTKAAASEMQNRLFGRLGEWAMLPDDELRGRLRALGEGDRLPSDTLRQARRLFATAIEAPGGLKIQTIHAFCAGLLRRFPLEAGVSPSYRELDEVESRALREAVAEDIAGGPHRAVFDAIAPWLGSEERLDDLLAEIIYRASVFAGAIDRAAIHAALGLADDETAESLASGLLGPAEREVLAALHAALDGKPGNDGKAAARLASLLSLPAGEAALTALESVLLTKENKDDPDRSFRARVGAFPTKATQREVSHLMPALDALMERVEQARPRRLALAAADRALALHGFARVFLPAYATRKAALGALDFDDLIHRADRLLSDRSVADWVLYRVDGGIDHILVDEAQDTSPAQWRVIEKLSAEFHAGEGVGGKLRTIFVVGDPKQSIYSFQGADLDNFMRVRQTFGDRLAAAGGSLQAEALEHSFRSADAILRVVDLAFNTPHPLGWPEAASHLPFHADRPGRVDLWASIPQAKADEEPDDVGPGHARPPPRAETLLAEAIAGELRRLIDAGTQIEVREEGRHITRALHEGDVMILVQGRKGRLFPEIIRACKAAGLAVAGSDRLKLSAELAVQDIRSLLSFLSLPEDDLALAGVLRSPLIGWSEAQLYDLASRRPPGSYLWSAFRERQDEFPRAATMLNDLRARADYLRPYEIIERTLTRHGGRQRLLDRLGHEAEEGIDAMLGHALAHERAGVPTLTGFLARLTDDAADIRRHPESAARAIRVMTVHGAKGLEAPLVILPDAGRPDTGGRLKNAVAVTDEGVPLWRVSRQLASARQEAADRAERERQQAERLRLLYVAMTRAERWLIVCAHGPADKECWHQIIAAGMTHAGAAQVEPPAGIESALRFELGAWPPDRPAPPAAAAPATAAPGWLEIRAPAVELPPVVLSPSDLGGPKALPGEAGQPEALAKAYGSALHRMLETLPAMPPAQRPALSEAILAEFPILADLAAMLEDDVARTLASPELARLLAAGALHEVEIAAPIAELGGRLARGAMDLLLVEPDRVTVVDYKSNAVVPPGPDTTPEGILRQLGAYLAMLAQVYPGRPVELAVFWTRTGQYMPVPCDIVRAALRRSTIP